MRTNKKIENRKVALCVWIILLIVLSVFRVWLRVKSGTWVLGAGFDDGLQLRLGGERIWLGNYDWVTLVKGFSFPAFLAVVDYLGIPYPCVFIGTILVCSGIFVLAISKKVKNPYILGLIYLFLIYYPMGFSTNISQRVYRNAITGWVLLVILASLLGMYWNKNESILKMIFWSVLCSLSFSYFWFLREDSIWILPLMIGAVSLTYGYIVIIRKVKWKMLIAYGILLILPFVMLMGTRQMISKLNQKYFGTSIINDRTEGNFAKMMGLLYRIEDPENTNSDRWITDKMLEKAMEVSPAFAILEPYMPENTEGAAYDGDLWQWSIRSAANDYGYYETALKAETYYAQVVKELEMGFADGRLTEKKAIYLSNQARGFTISELLGYSGRTCTNLWNLSGYRYCGIDYPKYAIGEKAFLEISETILNEHVLQSEDQLPRFPQMERAVSISNGIVHAYQILSPVIFGSAFLGYVFLTIRMIMDSRKKVYQVLDGWLVITGIGLSLILLTWIVTVFCGFIHQFITDDFYLCGAHAMIAALDVLIWVEAGKVIIKGGKIGKKA